MIDEEKSSLMQLANYEANPKGVTLKGMRVRLLLLLLPGLLCAQSLQEFEKKVTEFTLPNGMRFLIIERHEAPVVSFHTYVNVGSVDDPSGESGIAHMFEHMAFKGTPTIGTKNWPKEKAALAHIEDVYDKLDEEKNKGFSVRSEKIEALEAQVKDAISTADSFVEENEYDRIVESNGGVGMNAATAEDSTNYFYSFPSNRIELWFLLESERFLHPVFREFYKERDVVREERRMRVESSPQGKLVEALRHRVRGASISSNAGRVGQRYRQFSRSRKLSNFIENTTRRRTSPSASRAT